MAYAPENLNTIDCTPTWQSLTPVLLDIYAQNKSKVRNSYKVTDKTRQAIEVCNNILTEFKRMAEAADKWNEYCKQK